MSREEIIKWLESLKAEMGKSEHSALWHYAEAIDMAIEALTAPKTIIGIEPPYKNDKGIATFFTGKDDKLILEEIKEIVPVVRCKDCKHFTLNFVENVDGVPLIVAHEICSFWGDGCKTSQEGFCSFGEWKDENED